MFYGNVFKSLNKHKVRYVVAGGVAVVLHGVVRLTIDLDLYVELSEENLISFANAMDKAGYIPKVPVKGKDFAKASNREQDLADIRALEIVQSIKGAKG